MYQTTVKEFLKDDAGNLTGAVISCLKPGTAKLAAPAWCPPARNIPTTASWHLLRRLYRLRNYTADAFGVELTARNVCDHSFKRTNVDKVFVCGDMRH